MKTWALAILLLLVSGCACEHKHWHVEVWDQGHFHGSVDAGVVFAGGKWRLAKTVTVVYCDDCHRDVAYAERLPVNEETRFKVETPK